MSTWDRQELDAIGAADELEIAPSRADGSPRPFTTIWVVRVGDELYVRSYRGRRRGWFARAIATHAGRIRAGGVEREVRFDEPAEAMRDAIDQAYRDKYAQYSRTYLEPMVSPSAAEATLRLPAR